MNWTTTNIPDQHSRTALVTGANSGIGYEIASALYKKGAHLIIAARDLAMAEKAAKDLKSSGGCGSTEIEQLDLSSQSQIREFSSRIESRHQRIDLLFNNAGVMTPPEGKTEEG
ncbi:MAG: SDR family NAD(P)-dependent oxidoreductase [Sphingobacteriales bacterium]|nr:MAG: SDR family NAD(P)-dependent oxidoreductase [Sphingobacteriales bacterium]